MSAVTDEKIVRMQKSLSTLRKVAGWSAESLGERLGVTRQTIVNLETGQTKMTKVQYFAIRYIFDEECDKPLKKEKIDHDEENIVNLEKMMKRLVDDEGNITEKERIALREAVNDATTKVGRRAGSAAMSKAAKSAISTNTKLLGILTAITAVAAATSAVIDNKQQ